MSGFPGIEELNIYRTQTYKAEGDSNSAWLMHKAVSVISLSANGIAVLAGCGAMAASACTLGAVKVVIFFATLGHIDHPFSTGINWLSKKTWNSTKHLFVNLNELIVDGCKLVNQGVDLIRQAAIALHIDHVIKELFNFFNQGLIVVEKRIEKGVVAVVQDEKQSPKFHYLISHLLFPKKFLLS